MVLLFLLACFLNEGRGRQQAYLEIERETVESIDTETIESEA